MLAGGLWRGARRSAACTCPQATSASPSSSGPLALPRPSHRPLRAAGGDGRGGDGPSAGDVSDFLTSAWPSEDPGTTAGGRGGTGASRRAGGGGGAARPFADAPGLPAGEPRRAPGKPHRFRHAGRGSRVWVWSGSRALASCWALATRLRALTWCGVGKACALSAGSRPPMAVPQSLPPRALLSLQTVPARRQPPSARGVVRPKNSRPRTAGTFPRDHSVWQGQGATAA